MKEIFTDVLRRQLRALKPITTNNSIEESRVLQDKLGDLMCRIHLIKVNIVDQYFPGFRASWAVPKGDVLPGVIMYLHGGAYTAGKINYAVGFGSTLAAKTKRRVFCAAYRLAPEDPFPAALDDAVTAYKYLLDEGYSSSEILLCGESAGGGLICCLCLRLKELGLPLPAGIVAISPWSDLTLSGESYHTNEENDPSLALPPLYDYARMYAGEDLTNPLVSPLYGDLTGLPPTLMFAGNDELLRDDAVRLAQKLNDSGSPCTLYIEDGMWHAYVLYGVAEADAALEKIIAFAEERLGCL